MKKNYSNKLSKRLGQYGSLAVALTGLSEANSQVIYTDVNPDYSGSLGSSYAIDFDNDGVDDIILQNSVSSSQSYYFSSFIRALYANPQGDNEVLGSGSGGFTYPYALNSGNMISSNADGVFFNNSNTNSLNWNYGFSYFGYTYSVNDGNWVGVTDKYLGVKFDISGETHYGWVRLDVNEDSSFIVKDFAYEATPNTGILAGDQGEDISCAAPTALTVDNVTENTVTFSWTASPDETDGYDWALFAEGANIDTDTPITTGSVGTGMLNATVEGLDPETAYDIYVQTKCTSETSSDWEGPQTFTTETIPCAAPTALTVDTITENSVTFSWTASPDETDGYDWAVFAEGANIDTDTPIATGSVGTGMLNATVEGLDPETAYDIYVQTKCTSETSSDWEGPQTFTTETIPCAAPTALTVDTITENSVTFSWTASPDETDGYDWAVFAEGANIDTDTPIATGSVGTGMLNATVEGLDPETTYDIYVQTMCTSETSSDWEGPQTFTTDNLSTRNFESLDDLSLYPNPVSSILTIESKNSITAIEIYNLLGQKVYQVQVNKINPELDMSLLEKGTYFIKVYKNKICKNFKIIKE